MFWNWVVGRDVSDGVAYRSVLGQAVSSVPAEDSGLLRSHMVVPVGAAVLFAQSKDCRLITLLSEDVAFLPLLNN